MGGFVNVKENWLLLSAYKKANRVRLAKGRVYFFCRESVTKT